MGLLEEFPELKHRISVDEYHLMGEAGVLAPESRTELIEGEIIDMAPIGSRHAGKVNLLTNLMARAVGEAAVVQIQNPVRLGDHSEPVPDVALLKPRADYYQQSLPRSEDVLLLIEVSDTTLRLDRRVKVPLYARHGIPELWIVDLENALVHFHRLPGDGEYADVSSSADPGARSLAALPGVAIDLSRLF